MKYSRINGLDKEISKLVFGTATPALFAAVAPSEIANILSGSTTKVVDRAKVPTSPYTPNRSRNAMLGATVGAVAAVFYIVVITMMDVRIKSEEDLTAITSLPILGVIPEFEDEGKAGYVAKTEKKGVR